MIECTVENAPKFLEWCKTRGGVARWQSVNLSNPDQSWSTPVNREDGTPTPQPKWQAENVPSEMESDPDKITVYKDKEVRRFRIAVRMGRQGFMLKLTDASTKKVRAAVEAAGKGAFYRFDYETQEAVIFVPDSKMTLAEWAASQLPQTAGGTA